uniref:von Willebrand factor A domain-containing protein 7-like n=1 Tax=Crassostrea virginica TaxID=6565 RepID=A0A8B8ELV0_CRAVI|nr:von Willebrand factor A domain-containing protein 7-like [Crassostrea virginica]
MKLSLFFILGYYILLAKGFLPSQESTDGRPDYTHASITQAAIYQVAADVIANVIDPTKYNASDPDGTIQTYFTHDALIHFAQTVMEIVNNNNLAQRTYRDDAARTMNCEQIVPGHLLLQSLRDNIIHQSQSANPDWGFVRELTGQYLFTLQVFYSNTNWVEMFGDRVCQELGVPGKSLPLNVSGPDMVTCVSCNYSKEAVQSFSCVDNMRMDGQLLTSGYTSYQGINKPIGNFPPKMGKCSHGGPYDSSKDIPATGGINKETSSPELSPHFDLHKQAGEAAIKATYDFLIGNGTGLLSILGVKKFTEILGMNYKKPCYDCLAPGLSVVIVMDDTGSMSGEIREATQHSIDIVNQAKLLGVNGPSNYVLSTFNDPDTTIRKTTDGTEMKQWLHNLTAHGGGDCPEMALTGIINALNAANPGSCVFFFTDADAKDEDRKNEVIQLVNDKKIKLLYFLRGQCSSRRRRSDFTLPDNIQCIPNDDSKRVGRKRRGSGGFNLFETIASSTGGHIVHTSSSSLGSILGTFVKNNMGVSKVGVTTFELSSGSSHLIHVDSDLTLMTVRIKGLSSASDIRLVRPDGTDQTFTGTASADVIGSDTVLSIQKPPAGEWSLIKTTSGTSKVTVSGSGNIDFTYKFMEDVGGLKFPITGTSPITGSKLVISVKVSGMPPTAKVTHIILKKPNGVILSKLPVSDTMTGSDRQLSVNYDISTEEFYVSINGSYNSSMFTREKTDIVTPVTGEITFTSKPENLVAGQTSLIKVSVANKGSTSQSYEVTATTVPSGILSQSLHPISVGSNGNQEINLHLTAPNISIATLSVKLALRGRTIQTITRTLMIVDVPPPTINEVNRTADCTKETMNYYNCSTQSWSLVLEVTCPANLSQLYVTPNNVQLNYSNKASRSGDYIAILRGDCCSYKSQLNAIDRRGNMRKKSIDFSGGNAFNTTVENFEVLSKPSSSPKKTNQNHDITLTVILELIGAAILGLGAVVVIIILAVYYRKKHKKSSKTRIQAIKVSPVPDHQMRWNERAMTSLNF